MTDEQFTKLYDMIQFELTFLRLNAARCEQHLEDIAYAQEDVIAGHKTIVNYIGRLLKQDTSQDHEVEEIEIGA